MQVRQVLLPNLNCTVRREPSDVSAFDGPLTQYNGIINPRNILCFSFQYVQMDRVAYRKEKEKNLFQDLYMFP